MSIPEPYQDVQLPLPDPEAYPGEPREYARALMQRKDDIEKEIDTLNDVLASVSLQGGLEANSSTTRTRTLPSSTRKATRAATSMW